MQLSKNGLSPKERQHCLHLQLCFYCGQLGHRCSATDTTDNSLQTLLEIKGSPTKLVHNILDSRRRGHLQYLVNWEGYGPEEKSGVPANGSSDPIFLSEFQWAHPDHPLPRPRGQPRRRTPGGVPGRGLL